MKRRCLTWFKAGFILLDGVRSPSQNRHKNAQNRAKYSKNKGKSTNTVTKIKLIGLTEQR